MQDKDPMPNRRNVLKQTGAFLAGSAAIPVVVSARNETADLDTNFDPTDREQVKRFVAVLRTLPEHERLKLADHLSKAQQRAIFEALTPARFEVARIEEPTQNSDITVQASQGYDHYAVKAYSELGALLWKYHHEILWNYDYSSVSNITSSDYPTDLDPTWTFDGTNSSYVRNEGSYFDAYKQGEFHFCAVGGYFCGYYTYPYIEWRGYDSGSTDVLRSSCDCPDGGFET